MSVKHALPLGPMDEHHVAMDRAAVDAAVDRSPVNDDGRSGATLERVTLADGSRVIVKRFDPAVDIIMRMTDDERGREVDLFAGDLPERLPPSVRHAVLDGWYDADGRGVLVMRDLGDAVLSWTSVVSPEQARTMLVAVADLHAAFLGSAPEGLTPLDQLLGLFEPSRMRRFAGEPLVDLALRGWEYWPEVAPGEVGERVLALALDTGPLLAACRTLPATLLHGDLATVNTAFEPDHPGTLTLIDWGLSASGPAGLDIGRLLAGCAHLFADEKDDLLATYRDAAGAAYDDPGLRIGMLSGLTFLGWNKALDIVEHDDPAIRDRERVALQWWLHQAELAFETGLV